jgi:CRP/FNR family cyclic AMP-dependent transcriptional regulator
MDSNGHLSHNEILRMINTVPIFSGIGIHEQNILSHKCFIVEYDSGCVVIKQDEVADKLYVIIQGSVDVVKAKSHRSVRIDRLGRGDVFGEIAILRNIARTASIITIMPCKFLAINSKDFLEIYHYFSPQARNNIQLIVEKRLAHYSHSGY